MHRGSGCSLLKSQWAGQIGGKESLLYFRCQQLERRVVDICPKANSSYPTPVNRQWVRDRVGEGVTSRKRTVISNSHLQLIMSCLTNVVLVVSGTVIFSSKVSLFLFLWSHFSLFWQLISWLQSGHLYLVGLSVSQGSSQDMAQNIIYRPWGEIKCPWLCLTTTLVLFGLLWLFSFVSSCSHCSD